jgi:hypothetical protein
MTHTLLLLTLALAPADAPTPPPDAAVSDAGELQSEWELVSCVVNGREKVREYRGFRWVFSGSSAAFVHSSGSVCRRLALRVDAGRRATDADNLAAGDRRPQLGVYLRAGDELLWAEGALGGERPPAVEPAPDVRLWTLRRAKK